MAKDHKTTTSKPIDRTDALIRAPYVQGKVAGVRMMGGRLIKKDKKYRETEPFSSEFLEYLAAATRLIHFLSGFFDAIEEVFGERGYGKEMFDRVIGAHTKSKADRKFRDQVALVWRYLAEPNTSKVAREAAGRDILAASKLTNLKRWRKDKRITNTAKIDLMLGINTIDIKGRPQGNLPAFEQYGRITRLGHFF
jgi:hypothetical protein